MRYAARSAPWAYGRLTSLSLILTAVLWSGDEAPARTPLASVTVAGDCHANARSGSIVLNACRTKRLTTQRRAIA